MPTLSPRRLFQPVLVLITCLAAMTSLAGPSLSQSSTVVDRHSFDITLKGLHAATLSLAGEQTGNAYAVTAKLESRGLAAAVHKVRYDAAVQGRTRGGTYAPSAYSEQTDTGNRTSASVMEYRKGVPWVKRHDPPRDPRPDDLDPVQQGGTVDPLTALYATLRDVDAGQECRVSLQIFDGRRRTQVALSGRGTTGTNVTCQGEYRRVAGFPARDMAEKTRFPFTLTYAPVDGGRMRVMQITTETLFGTAILSRN